MNKVLHFDRRLESYKSFHDEAWAVATNSLAKATPYEQVTFDLMASWKGTAIVRELPWLMMHGMKETLETKLPKDASLTSMILSGLEERLVSMMGLFPMSQNQRTQLRQSLQIIHQQLLHVEKLHPAVVDIERNWIEFISIPDFAMRLWKSEQNAYASIYYAYEDYLTRCVGIAKQDPTYRWFKAKTFVPEFVKCFGTRIGDLCLSDPAIELARLVRHAIVHNGGRMTEELKDVAAQFPTENNELVIMAPDTTDLYNLLKDRAAVLLQTATRSI